VGAVIDVVLLIAWIGGGPAPEHALAFASIAQSLILAGAIIAGFAMVYKVLVRQSGYRHETGDVDILHFGLAYSLTIVDEAQNTNAEL
jgi:hypothetical protein